MKKTIDQAKEQMIDEYNNPRYLVGCKKIKQEYITKWSTSDLKMKDAANSSSELESIYKETKCNKYMEDQGTYNCRGPSVPARY